MTTPAKTETKKSQERKERFETSWRFRWNECIHRLTFRWTTRTIWVIPANIPLHAAFSPPCTAAASGRCASMPASPAPRNPTSAIAICSSKGRLVFPWRSTCRRKSATTPTIRWRWAKWAKSAWPSAFASTTWRCCSTAFRSTRFRTSMTINATGGDFAGDVHRRGQKTGRRRRANCAARCRTTFSRSTSRAAPTSIRRAPAMRLVTDIFRLLQTEVPNWNTITISGYHIREAGSTAVQEVAFTLAMASPTSRRPSTPAWMSTISRRSCPSSSTRTTTSSKKSPSSAPRAACGRKSCATVLARKIRARWQLRFHAQTGGLHAHRAAAGKQHRARGHCRRWPRCWAGRNPCTPIRMDEALALPTEEAVQIALRTQQIIAHETGVADTVDPAGRRLRHRTADRRNRAAGRGIYRPDR